MNFGEFLHLEEKKKEEINTIYDVLISRGYDDSKFRDFLENVIVPADTSNQDLFLKNSKIIIEVTTIRTEGYEKFNKDQKTIILDVYKKLREANKILIPIFEIRFKDDIDIQLSDYTELIHSISCIVEIFANNQKFFEDNYLSIVDNDKAIIFLDEYLYNLCLKDNDSFDKIILFKYIDQIVIELDNEKLKYINNKTVPIQQIKESIRDKHDFENFALNKENDIGNIVNDIINNGVLRKVRKGKPQLLKLKKYRQSKMFLIIKDTNEEHLFNPELKIEFETILKSKIDKIENCFFDKIFIWINNSIFVFQK